MATEKTRIQDRAEETEQAQAIAARYRCEYVDLREAGIDHDLFRSIPVDLMFRYNFVPLHAQNGTLEIALSDPRNLNLIDELTLLLNKKLRVKVATLSQISELLKKTEQSQRVLEEVTEGFALDVVREDGDQDDVRGEGGDDLARAQRQEKFAVAARLHEERGKNRQRRLGGNDSRNTLETPQ
jgi:type IV pilus assembly protein PilB